MNIQTTILAQWLAQMDAAGLPHPTAISAGALGRFSFGFDEELTPEQQAVLTSLEVPMAAQARTLQAYKVSNEVLAMYFGDPATLIDVNNLTGPEATAIKEWAYKPDREPLSLQARYAQIVAEIDAAVAAWPELGAWPDRDITVEDFVSVCGPPPSGAWDAIKAERGYA